jgi:cation diffusion facilitator CzcD-associated flavoprotein CzcO
VDKVCEVFDLRKYMKFESRITRAEWIAETGKWKISVEQKQDDGSLKTFDDECDVFLYAVGVLNNYKFPELKGIDKFKGKVFVLILAALWSLTDQRGILDLPQCHMAFRLPREAVEE